MTDASTTIASFLSDTAGRGSPARLRAILLDEAATSGRVNRREIDAIVRAYELGAASVPADQWSSLHAQVAAEVDPTSASVAFDEWATALSTTWREVAPPDTTDDREVTTGRPVVILGSIALIVAAVIGIGLSARSDDSRSGDAATTTGTEERTESTPSTPDSLRGFFVAVDAQHCEPIAEAGDSLPAQDMVIEDFGDGVVAQWQCTFEAEPGQFVVAEFAQFESPSQAAAYVDRRTAASVDPLEGGAWSADDKAGTYVVDGPESGSFGLAWNYADRPFAGTASAGDYDTLMNWWAGPISAP